MKKNSWIFLFFFLVVFVFYLPAQNATFVNDTFFYLYEIETTGWKGILNSYHMIFLWHVPSVAYFILYKLFGMHWFGWHVVISCLHSLNAFLLFVLLQKIWNKKWVSFFSAFLFLISPFQTEVVAWGATLHYLLILSFLLSGFLILLKYFESFKIRYLIFYHFLFLLSLSCFEQAFLYPLLYACFALLIVPVYFSYDAKTIAKAFFVKCFLFNGIAMAGYFMLTKIVFGTWIAHYGAGTHAVIDIKEMWDNFINYNFKFFFYYRYLPDTLRQYYRIEGVHEFILVSAVIVIIAGVCFAWRKKIYLSLGGKLFIFLVLSYGLMLLPVLNLDRSFTFEIQSDRYGYIASCFFYPLLVLSGYRLLNKKIFFFMMAAEITLCILFLVNGVHLWRRSGQIVYALLDAYPLKPSQKAYIVNLPDNYRGVYMLRNGISEGLSLLRKENYRGSITSVALINILSRENETDVKKTNDSTYYVKCLKEGKWYNWKNDKGNFKVQIDKWNFAYDLTVRRSETDTLFLLWCYGDKWKVADTILPLH